MTSWSPSSALSAPMAARAAVRSTSLAWRTIWPRSRSASKTSPDRSPVRMSRLRSAYAGSLNRWTDSSSWCACGSHPACGEVEDAAAADGRELVAVAEERDAWRALGRRWRTARGRCPGRACRPRRRAGRRRAAGVPRRACRVRSSAAGPVAVVVPAVAVLVDEPGGGERVGADLLLRCLGGLEGRGDDHESTVGGVEYVARGGQGGGLAGAGGAFDHEQTGVAGQRRDDASLRGVEVVDAAEPDRVGHRPRGACSDAVDQVGFDGEDPLGGQAADVLGDVVSVQQRHAPRPGTVGDVLDQLAPDRVVRRRRRRRRSVVRPRRGCRRRSTPTASRRAG